MISLFVKVDGYLRRYDTDETPDHIADVYGYLRKDVLDLLPKNGEAKSISPVLLLIDNTK